MGNGSSQGRTGDSIAEFFAGGARDSAEEALGFRFRRRELERHALFEGLVTIRDAFSWAQTLIGRILFRVDTYKLHIRLFCPRPEFSLLEDSTTHPPGSLDNFIRIER